MSILCLLFVPHCVFVAPLQSGYFSSMFSGSWKESNMMEINLEIPDQNIDTEGESCREATLYFNFVSFFTDCILLSGVSAALQVVFGSLYRDDVLIKPSRVISILAAACMLQLVGTPSELPAVFWNGK